MIDVETALRLVCEHARPRPAVALPLAETLGLVLAEPLRADRDYPPFARAMMDGYAVKVADGGKTLPVIGEVAAGDPTPRSLEAGSCFEIMTGAPCPQGTEAVVKKEDIERHGDRVRLPDRITRDQHVVARGAECRRGEVRLSPGSAMTPVAAALAAAFGRATLKVVRRPTLAIIATGSELVARGQEVGPAQIRDSNAPMLCAMARAVGIADIDVQHATDDLDALGAALERASGRDIVVLSGGVSAGKYDLVPQAVSASGAAAVFHKIRQKPGKPLLFATRADTLVFGLPGTPLGSHLGFHRYVATAARIMMGHRADSTWGTGVLSGPLRTRGERVKFFLARAELRRDAWELTCKWGHGSSDLYAVPDANAYIRVPGGDLSLPAGAAIPFQWAVGGPS